MNKHRPIPTDIGLYLSYDPETGSITWKEGVGYKSRRMIGKENKHLTANGYIAIGFRQSTYAAGRIAWFLGTGKDPGDKTVDHINRKPADNRLVNLRLKTHKEQQHNKNVLGYYWSTSEHRFITELRDNGKRVYSSRHQCPLLARIAYQEASIRQHNLEGLHLLPDIEIKGRPYPLKDKLTYRKGRGLGYRWNGRKFDVLFKQKVIDRVECPLLARLSFLNAHKELGLEAKPLDVWNIIGRPDMQSH